MRITADANVLVRALTGDDPRQSPLAQAALAEAEAVALPIPVLCELVWVLRRGYGIATPEIADAIRRLIGSATAAVNRTAAEAGLAMLDAGGDFADGAIAHEGRWLGATEVLSFDKRAVSLLEAQGLAARLLG